MTRRGIVLKIILSKFLLLISIVVLTISMFGCNKNENNNLDISIKNGHLEEVNVDSKRKDISVKVRIDKKEEDKETINQNLANINSIINSIDTSIYNNLYYYAICDIDNKVDIPIISLTIDKNDMVDIKNGKYSRDSIFALSNDLWIYPSLAKEFDLQDRNMTLNSNSTSKYQEHYNNKSTINTENKNNQKNVTNNVNDYKPNTNKNNIHDSNTNKPSDNEEGDNNDIEDDGYIKDDSNSESNEEHSESNVVNPPSEDNNTPSQNNNPNFENYFTDFNKYLE